MYGNIFLHFIPFIDYLNIINIQIQNSLPEIISYTEKTSDWVEKYPAVSYSDAL